MKQMIDLGTVLMIALLASNAQAVTRYDTGAGNVFRLEVVQDVTLERSSTNFNYLQYLIVSKHPGYPNKRSLVQFENLPSDCPSSRIKSAQMYLFYDYAHKASGRSITQVPFLPRYMQLHLVKKTWIEAQATSGRRDSSNLWSTPYLALDDTDAEEVPEPGTVTIFPKRPKGFVEFNVTNAVKKWKDGFPNNGLLIRATNELDEGRDIRFASNAMADVSQHAYILVSVAPTSSEASGESSSGIPLGVSSSSSVFVNESVAYANELRSLPFPVGKSSSNCIQLSLCFVFLIICIFVFIF